ncbi:MAG: aminoacyl-histidine dipeptidase [Bacteroidetes bacterium]|nr:aminoacyl-histidine dipeptidase [Bacteroidota bacterium]
MARILEGLKPELVWKYFEEISRIPRGSKNEKAISKYVLDTAKSLGLEAKQDKFLNVVVKKPATRGKESLPSVCLQSHLDMVCEKNKDTVHDFTKDPIELIVKDNVIVANGTTLGADNGIGVATCLALMEAKDIEHGPLEFLFTVDEETGLTGASNLQQGSIESKILLNLDSEEEGQIYVGCSGGTDTTLEWSASLENVPQKFASMIIKVKGLKGGHSGLEIDKGRGNSIKILNRVLLALEEFGVRVSSFDGGNKSNAIPREAEAVVFIPIKKLNDCSARVSQWNSIIREELATVEPDLSISVEEIKVRKGTKVWRKKLQWQVLRTLSAMPHGVIKMSADIKGLVETSTNLAIIKSSSRKIELITSQRSSVASEIEEIAQQVRSIGELGGAKVTKSDGYPGWKPNLDSPILKIANEIYKQLFGKEPEVKAVHAGLECGIIGEKNPGMDMISFGPTLEGVHSPDEKIYIDSVEKFWKFLLAILKNVQ